MEKEEVGLILENQRKFFSTGKTLDISYRIDILKKLRSLIIEYKKEIIDSMWKDFHKPESEVITSEVHFVLTELNLTIKELRKWSEKKRVRTPIIHFIASSYIEPQPYGQALILSPWNFPFQLSLVPVLGALAAGNCVVLKVSRQVPETSAVIEKLISHFDNELITVINGDHSISEYLLNYKFDYIFFTGSCKVGRYVMEKAAVNLTPLSLEMGGKSPCVVASDARLDFAVKRIAWGKFYNAGQTCVCPDYVLIDRKVKDRFLDLITKEIRAFYGDNPEQSKDFTYVVNSASAVRLASFMKAGQVVTGGKTDPVTCYVAPTVIKDVKPGDPVMQEEIFGPVLPVIDYENFSEVYEIIGRNPKPLSVYIFTRNKKLALEFLSKTQSGSSAINDTVTQYASPYLPFGGVGSSGMGRYHGRKSFETFSNMRSVLVKSNLIDIFIRYPPYSKLKVKILEWLMR
jgi:NAD-dependent aldehyde dehydrogenases